MLESHRRDVTVVFCDLRGFTAFAETAEPEEVMTVLREYHAALGALIHKYEGTLERFAGDGLMVLFNDPLPCPDPCAARGAAWRWRCATRSPSSPPSGASSATSSASASASRTATPRSAASASRAASTMPRSARVVNLAARLCGEAKNGQILIDGKVQAAVEAAAQLEPLGELRTQGLSPADQGLQRPRGVRLTPSFIFCNSLKLHFL